MALGDPLLYNLILEFFGENWQYTPVLPSDFNSTFYLKRETALDYSFRSQFLNDVVLTGKIHLLSLVMTL